jgi:hypothetical protein
MRAVPYPGPVPTHGRLPPRQEANCPALLHHRERTPGGNAEDNAAA